MDGGQPSKPFSETHVSTGLLFALFLPTPSLGTNWFESSEKLMENTRRGKISDSLDRVRAQRSLSGGLEPGQTAFTQITATRVLRVNSRMHFLQSYFVRLERD